MIAIPSINISHGTNNSQSSSLNIDNNDSDYIQEPSCAQGILPGIFILILFENINTCTKSVLKKKSKSHKYY